MKRIEDELLRLPHHLSCVADDKRGAGRMRLSAFRRQLYGQRQGSQDDGWRNVVVARSSASGTWPGSRQRSSSRPYCQG